MTHTRFFLPYPIDEMLHGTDRIILTSCYQYHRKKYSKRLKHHHHDESTSTHLRQAHMIIPTHLCVLVALPKSIKLPKHSHPPLGDPPSSRYNGVCSLLYLNLSNYQSKPCPLWANPVIPIHRCACRYLNLSNL